MSRRTERVGNVLRQAIADVVMRKIADPRIEPARISVTRVDVAQDLLTANVYVSVMGSEAQQRCALTGLQHAAGHIQELVSDRVSLRHVPVLSFHNDDKLKKTMQTLTIIQQAMDEIHRKGAAAPDHDEVLGNGNAIDEECHEV